MITLTENAKDYLTDMVSKSEDTYARLSVKGGGCVVSNISGKLQIQLIREL